MSPHSMPPELVELENRLRNRPSSAPTESLREIVMEAVTAELATARQSSARNWDGRYWPAAAAAVLIIVNLSMLFASQDAFSSWPKRGANQTTTEFQALQQLELQQEGIFK